MRTGQLRRCGEGESSSPVKVGALPAKTQARLPVGKVSMDFGDNFSVQRLGIGLECMSRKAAERTTVTRLELGGLGQGGRAGVLRDGDEFSMSVGLAIEKPAELLLRLFS